MKLVAERYISRPRIQFQMKVVHVVGGRLDKGAARGALWLHQALRRQGIDSNLLAQYGPPAPGIETLDNGPAQKLKQMALGRLDSLPFRLYSQRARIPYATGFFGNRVQSAPLVRQADIVHCHWINSGTLSIFSLAKLNKPVVWTLRDMWPFTGGCHYSLSCDRYRVGCGKCPYLKSSAKRDVTKLVYARKRRAYPSAEIYPVAISNWLARCAEESSLFSNVAVIPNGIDPEVFSPIDKAVARQILGLPGDRTIILAGAQRLNDFYKGFDHYLNAIPKIVKHLEPFFLFFGRLDKQSIPLSKAQFRTLGLLKDDISLRLAYSAADAFVAPSTQEAFGKTIIESMACATPVVAFGSTGPQDIITHGVDGYLAEPNQPDSLAAGVSWILDHRELVHISAAARRTVLTKFTTEIVADQYHDLYRTILGHPRAYEESAISQAPPISP